MDLLSTQVILKLLLSYQKIYRHGKRIIVKLLSLLYKEEDKVMKKKLKAMISNDVADKLNNDYNSCSKSKLHES